MALPDNPISRNEQYLAAIAGQEVELPDYPITREEQYLAYIAENGGGGGGGSSIEIVTSSIEKEGIAGNGGVFADITVNIPQGKTVVACGIYSDRTGKSSNGSYVFATIEKKTNGDYRFYVKNLDTTQQSFYGTAWFLCT